VEAGAGECMCPGLVNGMTARRTGAGACVNGAGMCTSARTGNTATAQPRQCGWRVGQSVSSSDMDECLVLLEGVYVPSGVVSEVWGSSRHHDHDVDPWIETRAVLGDSDKQVR
jgi:hypothetical protein